MPRRVFVLNVVGLTHDMLGADTPNLTALAGRGEVHRLMPVLPAVTCSAQSTMLTGLAPSEHGIVGNGWYDRTLNEVHFWKQSNALVAGEKVWESARRRDPAVTCANCFWWHAMYSSATVTVTPRPMYPADGRKLPDLWTHPPEWRDELQSRLGQFPLFSFWGPRASIESTRWIGAGAAATARAHRPTLTLVYLPHLDYPLQRLGPDDPAIAAELRAVDAVAGELIEVATELEAAVVVVSEYGIDAVAGAGAPNIALREAGLLGLREELGRELLDPGASRAFAVVDHQVAHVYVRDPADRRRAREALATLPEVETVLDRAAQAERGLDHPRSGDLVLVARPDRWFSYGWWLDDARAPDYARTVDIHRKPGYDPAELLLDPAIRFPRLRVGWTLAKRKLGQRSLLDVIPLDAGLVRGSHGRVPDDPARWPIMIAPRRHGGESLPMAEVRDVLLRELFD